jgi:hypothetical protein
MMKERKARVVAAATESVAGVEGHRAPIVTRASATAGAVPTTDD